MKVIASHSSLLYDVPSTILMLLWNWNLIPTCCRRDVETNFLYLAVLGCAYAICFLRLKVWGGVLWKQRKPPGGTVGQKRAMTEGRGRWWETLKTGLCIPLSMFIFQILETVVILNQTVAVIHCFVRLGVFKCVKCNSVTCWKCTVREIRHKYTEIQNTCIC